MIVLLFYKDPSTEARSKSRRTLGKVASDMVEVLGNLRFGVTVFVVLMALMLANSGGWFEWFGWAYCAFFIPLWLVGNFLYDQTCPLGSDDGAVVWVDGKQVLRAPSRG